MADEFGRSGSTIGRWDRRTVTSVCLGITGLFSLGTALAPTYTVALVVVYAAALAPPRFLAAGIALVTGGSQLAAALVIPAAVAAVEHVHWRWIYRALAGLAIAIAIGVRAALPAGVPAAPAGTNACDTLPWREKRLVDSSSRG